MTKYTCSKCKNQVVVRSTATSIDLPCDECKTTTKHTSTSIIVPGGFNKVLTPTPAKPSMAVPTPAVPTPTPTPTPVAPVPNGGPI